MRCAPCRDTWQLAHSNTAGTTENSVINTFALLESVVAVMRQFWKPGRPSS